MTQTDYDAFVGEFRRLSAALAPYKHTPEEARAKADAYFHALKRFSLAEVIVKGDHWLATEAKMPKPVEWAGVVIQRGIEIPTLADEQAREWLRAERLCWDDAPCACRDCQSAGVTDQPLRFVPDALSDGRDAKARIGDRIVTTGHWAHGGELLGWYLARAAFWERCVELGLLPPDRQGPTSGPETAHVLAEAQP